MKTQIQKLQAEFGLYLRILRTSNHLSMNAVARKLGFTSANFIARIESGDAPIPIERLGHFARVYEAQDEAAFIRLALVASHNETFTILMHILMQDGEMARVAHRVHSTKNDDERRKRSRALDPGIASKSLDRMRAFILKHKKLIPEGKLDKRNLFDWDVE